MYEEKTSATKRILLYFIGYTRTFFFLLEEAGVQNPTTDYLTMKRRCFFCELYSTDTNNTIWRRKAPGTERDLENL